MSLVKSGGYMLLTDLTDLHRTDFITCLAICEISKINFSSYEINDQFSKYFPIVNTGHMMRPGDDLKR